MTDLSKDNIKYSFIVPAYNASKTIIPCLEGIIIQTGAKFEIVVVDDASTDDTALLAEKMNVKIVRLKGNSGASGSRNAGVKNASAEIIVFVDSDIILFPDALKIIEEDFKNYPDIVGVNGHYSPLTEYPNFLSKYKNLYFCHILQSTPAFNPGFHSAIFAMKKKVFLELGDFRLDVRGIEDGEYSVRLMERSLMVFLDSRLQGNHIKTYNLKQLIKEDIHKIVWLTRLSTTKDENSKKFLALRAKHTPTWKMISSLLTPALTVMSAFASIFIYKSELRAISLFLLFLFFFSKADLLSYYARYSEFLSFIKSMIFMFLEMLLAQIVVTIEVIKSKLLGGKWQKSL